jgi:hypothetical protein
MARTLNAITRSLGLCLALAACGDVEPPVVSPPLPEKIPTSPSSLDDLRREPLPIEGNRFASRAFGFSVEKPEGWVFVEPSSLLRDGPERLRHRADLWKLLDAFERVPLVPFITIAPRAEPVRGVDPIFTAHVIPMRPEDSDRGVELMRGLRQTDVVVTFAQGTRSDLPGFQLFLPSAPGKLSGLDAGVIEMRYDSEQDGASHPTRERLHHVRRDQEFWYFRLMTAEPRSEADLAQLDAILASVVLEP